MGSYLTDSKLETQPKQQNKTQNEIKIWEYITKQTNTAKLEK